MPNDMPDNPAPKMHKDHTATCLCCQAFVGDYDPGWSDHTPGYGFRFRCKLDHFSDYDAYQMDWHDMTMQAQSCNDFEGRE